MPLTKLPSTHQTQGRLMVKPFYNCPIPQEDTWSRTQIQTKSRQRFWMLLWCWLLQILEQGICSSGSQYCQIAQWMDCLLCWLSCLLGFQTSITSCTICGIHCYVYGFERCHSCHESNWWNEGQGLPSHLYSTLCLLQGIWGQLWCIGTSLPSKTTTQNQTHQ